MVQARRTRTTEPPEISPHLRLRKALERAIETRLPEFATTTETAYEQTRAVDEVGRTQSMLLFGEKILPWESSFEFAPDFEKSVNQFANTLEHMQRIAKEHGISTNWFRTHFQDVVQQGQKAQIEMLHALSQAVNHPEGIDWLGIPVFAQLAKLKETLTEIQSRVSQELEQAVALKNQLRQEVRIKAVGDQESRFETAASSAGRDSIVWLMIAVLTAIGLFIYVGFSLHELSQWAEIVPRVMTASVGYALLYWSFRNYAAAKHNQTVNEHRANSLATMRQFLLTEEAPDTRKEILSQALLSAFGQQPSGFIGSETAPDMSRIINNLQSAPPRA